VQYYNWKQHCYQRLNKVMNYTLLTLEDLATKIANVRTFCTEVEYGSQLFNLIRQHVQLIELKWFFLYEYLLPLLLRFSDKILSQNSTIQSLPLWLLFQTLRIIVSMDSCLTNNILSQSATTKTICLLGFGLGTSLKLILPTKKRS
jgi:hypothetical protein